MNLRLACDTCGQQPCLCFQAECRACNGEGKVEHPAIGSACSSIVQESPNDPPLVDCSECGGEGWITCDRGGVDCPFKHCYCEAAWEAAQERNDSEPPLSADERHRLAWEEKQRLRG